MSPHLVRALVLAERGRATCRPNPPVGCVLVAPSGEVVGEGTHVRAGGPHAEVVALRAAGPRASGATAYVSLEPCDHTGRTGPCSQALVVAGVGRVVIAAPDPTPAGGGADRLRAGGVAVEVDAAAAPWAHRQTASWRRYVLAGRPWVTLKLACTLDGALVTPRRWITGGRARRRVHELRADHDAVLVGIGTVLADDPRLDVRDAPTTSGQPLPVVLDSTGRIPADARVVRRGAVVLVATRERLDERVLAAADVREVAAAADGRVDVRAALVELAREPLQRVLAEPGPTLAAALVAAGVVDELVLHVAGSVAAGPPALPRPVAGRAWSSVGVQRLGPDVELRLAPG